MTGPAKNLLEFCRRARQPATEGASPLPAVLASIVTYQRRPPVNGQASNGFIAAARAEGLSVNVIDERFRFDTRVLGQLRRIVAEQQPDIIQTHNIKSHLLVRLSGLWKHYPWVAYHHGYTTTDLKMLAYNRLDRLSLPHAHRVLTVCGPFAEDLSRAGASRERIKVLHNSVKPFGYIEAEDVRALRERLGIMEGERVVLAVGRFSREKAQGDLINAMGQLRQHNPEINFKLLLVGEGPERARLESLAAALGLTSRVIFAGHVGEVRPYYALADLLALPSHSEGSPNVILEAMAAGLPVLATAVGGVPEIVTHEETGLLVQARDTAAMAAGAVRLLTEGELSRRLSANALALVSERFSPEAYRRGLVQIYCELLAARRSARP